MNNQSKLNAVPLQEAAVMISNELIKARRELERTRDKLLKDKKVYEEAYVLANDGDSSENAPLEAAIQNLKLVTGEIGNNTRVLQIMEGLEDVQYLMGTFDFRDIYVAIGKLDKDSRDALCKSFGIKSDLEIEMKMKKASPEEIQTWCVNFGSWCKANNECERNDECLGELVKFLKVAQLPAYNECGIVVPYTTVRLEMGGKIMTYRIYPDGVSFIDIGVMAANSRVARAILGKEKGQSVSIRHDSNNTLLEYKIVDIY